MWYNWRKKSQKESHNSSVCAAAERRVWQDLDGDNKHTRVQQSLRRVDNVYKTRRKRTRKTNNGYTQQHTYIVYIYIYTQTGRMLMGSSHSCRAGGPVGRWRKTGNGTKTFFFSFLISISRSPPTHTTTTASIVVSLSGFFFCLFSSLSTDHYLKSHLFFLFLFSFVSYFNFDERVFSRFCFFFLFFVQQFLLLFVFTFVNAVGLSL